MTNYYAGIGSRAAPDDILDDMVHLAKFAAVKGWTLRSGAAQGSDTAFEEGCDSQNGKKEIYLPWKGFNGHTSFMVSSSDEAFHAASVIHPAYHSLTQPVKLLLARNMHQILGKDMNTPVRCVICWTPDGCENRADYSSKTGGTGSAIALASLLGIQIFNLFHKPKYDEAISFLLDPDEAEILQL